MTNEFCWKMARRRRGWIILHLPSMGPFGSLILLCIRRCFLRSQSVVRSALGDGAKEHKTTLDDGCGENQALQGKCVWLYTYLHWWFHCWPHPSCYARGIPSLCIVTCLVSTRSHFKNWPCRVKRSKKILQSGKSLDCAIFCTKFVECATVDGPISCLDQKHMKLCR